MTARLEAGTLFADRYEVEAILGEGAMGVVAQVRDRAVGERVALKLLRCAALGEREAVARMRREVRLTRRITHRNVIRIHDIGEVGDDLFLTMELVQGGDLDRWLAGRDGRARGEDIEGVITQVCDGLEAAHAAGVVHRDLKPSNVLVAADDRVVLSDFGVARSLLGEGDAAKTGGAIGTPHYMAPEQLRGQKVDERADIYALGCMLYELFTGRLPFEASSPLLCAFARLNDDPDDPREHADLPQALAELITSCLAREPDARPASARAVREAFERCRGGTPELPSTMPIVRPATLEGEQTGAREQREAQAWANAPTLRQRDLKLAVLPLRARGDASVEELAEQVSEEIVDVINLMPGVRVLGIPATERFRDTRDPGSVGSELDVHMVVDGRIDGGETRTRRLVVRLLDVASGEQLWHGRFVVDLDDLLGADAALLLAWRGADALRHQLTVERAGVSNITRRAYEIAREEMRRYNFTAAAARFAECFEQSPGFVQALVGRGQALASRWLASDDGTLEVARPMIERAVSEAPDLAEAHNAAAVIAAHDGRFHDVMAHLQRASTLAPAYAEAMSQRALYECEAGRVDIGIARARRAHALEPTLLQPLVVLARTTAMLGRFDEHAEWVARAERAGHGNVAAFLVSRLRIAGWRRDHAVIDEVIDRLPLVQRQYRQMVEALARALRGDLTPRAYGPVLEQIIGGIPNQRMVLLVRSIAVELCCLGDDQAQALAVAAPLREAPFIDVTWLERCPVIESIRDHELMRELRRVAQRRAEVFWSAPPAMI
ncbi:MAG: protein kinase [Myxococcales bacterium]|nr:protein kinase [Myxococcales bacterium]